MKLSCTECCHYLGDRKCSALVNLQCMKRGKCTFFQTCEQMEKSERAWAEKILKLPKTKLDLYNKIYYKGRLEKYAKEIISKANQR